MEQLYGNIESWTPEQYDEAWRQWVWVSDCNALPTERCCDMNPMHGWGILCCAREWARPVTAYHESVEVIAPHIAVLHLQGEKPISEFSLREMVDQIECMQLHWGKIVGLSEDHGEALLKAIMARVGFVANHAFETKRPEEGYEVNNVSFPFFMALMRRGREQDAILDDPQHTTSLPQAHNAAATTSMGIISRKSLRQIICVLVSLARVQGIAQRAIPTPTYATETIHANVVQALRLHHVEVRCSS